jgi:hypothetical protein
MMWSEPFFDCGSSPSSYYLHDNPNNTHANLQNTQTRNQNPKSKPSIQTLTPEHKSYSKLYPEFI